MGIAKRFLTHFNTEGIVKLRVKNIGVKIVCILKKCVKTLCFKKSVKIECGNWVLKTKLLKPRVLKRQVLKLYVFIVLKTKVLKWHVLKKYVLKLNVLIGC